MKLSQYKNQGKRVIIRCDFNVPIQNGEIVSNKRITESLPTINYLLKKKSKIILIAHLGQPKGKIVESLRLKIIYNYLKTILPIEYEPRDFRLPEVQERIKNIKSGSALLLENIRFYPEEEQPATSPARQQFCKNLCDGSELFVNEAFSVSHRKHASITCMLKYTKFCAMGFLFAREINYLREKLKNPNRPFIAIVGGAKISSKLLLLKKLLVKIDRLLVGGAMVFTFLSALGYKTGKSMIEPEYIPEVLELLQNYRNKIILPIDFLVTEDFRFPHVGTCKHYYANALPKHGVGVDIGGQSCKLFARYIKRAKTILWNGPMGVFENSISAQGTNMIMHSLADRNHKIMTIVGGGDSINALEQTGFEQKISHISTGGGASLDLLANGTLPGYQALCDISR